MKRTSIRVRLTLWYVAVLSGGMAVFGLATWFSLEEALTLNRENALEQRLAGLAQFIEQESLGDDIAAIQEEAREYSTGMQEGHWLRIWDGQGDLIFERSGTDEAHLMIRRASFTVRGHAIEAELGSPSHDFHRTLRMLRNIMLGLFPIVLAIAWAGGWALARQALAPVDRMTQEARSIGARDLSARLSVPETGDELQRLARAWNEMLGRIESSVRGVTRFTADAAHELRTPVAVIRASAELALRQERSPESYRAALGAVQRETAQMTELLDQLLLLARGDAGQWNFQFDAVLARGTAQDALQAVAPLAETKGVTLDRTFPSEDALIWADSGALRRLMLILLDNAVKFTDAGGRVTLRVAFSAGECVLEVEDTGRGIPHEDLPRLFERFYRVDPARTPGTGAGLGLAIAHTIAEAHQGRIEASSDGVRGALFRLTLPLRDLRDR